MGAGSSPVSLAMRPCTLQHIARTASAWVINGRMARIESKSSTVRRKGGDSFRAVV